MQLPTIEQLKAAKSNEAFFAPHLKDLYSDKNMDVAEIIWAGEKHMVLRVTSEYGTKPIYKIDPATLHLTYLTHAPE